MEEIKTDLKEVAEAFVESSEQLVLACQLCGDDPLKQELVRNIHEDFLKMQMRFMGLQLMVQKGTIEREMVLAEMRELTRLNRSLAKKVEDKLISYSN